jgi:hypothetical protein
MLEKLTQYKELLAIVVFFLGGFFWIQNEFARFPTKTDLRSEIQVLNCLLDKYMILTQLQLRGRELERQVQVLTNQIGADGSDGESGPLTSPAMHRELEDKKAELTTARGDLRGNVTEIQKTNDDLQRNVCRRGDQ